MIKTKSSSILLLTLVMFGGLILSCEQRQTTAIEGVVVTVNGVPITEFDLSLAARTGGGHMKQAPVADKEEIMEALILQELAYQKAVKLGLDGDAQYHKELSAMEAQVNAFKRKKLSDILLQKEMLQKIEINDAEMQQYFRENEKQLRTMLNVWQILSRNEDTIKKIQEELAQGLSFEEVAAKQFPNLQKSDKKPWEIGYLQWNQIPDVWRSVINKMQVGDTSNIIQGSNKRFWIIKLIDKRENMDLTFEQIKPRIMDILKDIKFQQLREKTIRDLRDNASIVYSK